MKGTKGKGWGEEEKKEGKEKRRDKRETRSDGAMEPKMEYKQKPMNKMALPMITQPHWRDG